MNIRIAAAARADMGEAADPYDQDRPGTGARFLRSVMATLDEICLHPEAWG